MPGVIKKIFCIIFILAIVVVAQSNLSTAEQDKEYKVKAAFVYNFMKFVEWETMEMGDSFKDRSNIVLAVVGESPFGGSLDSLESKSVNEKNVKVDYYKYSQLSDQAVLKSFQDANVIFICKSESARYKDILAKLTTQCVLTIGDESKFASDKGMVAFDIEGGKVCFDINFDNAKDGGVKINAKLLKLARKVYKQ